jgi:chromosome segregation ATPase
MDWITDYLWTPLLLAAAYFWRMLHRHDKEIAECTNAHETTAQAISEAKGSRKEIYDKIETVRKDLTDQHTTLRKEIREDFKETRNMIATLRE